MISNGSVGAASVKTQRVNVFSLSVAIVTVL